jgi:murein DD-endopeptidase MepM/ murein hydrolase activator NlpD
MGTAVFIFKHWKKILGAIVCGLLIFAMKTDEKNQQNACTSTAGSTGPVTTKGLAYPMPIDTNVISGYGLRTGEYSGFHHGADFAAPLGTPIYAFADGTVVDARDQGVDGFGGWVVILHTIEGKEMSTVYGHEDPGGVMVKTGDHVKAGQQIARVGNSGQSGGPHMHFELHNGNRMNGMGDIDPEPWTEKVREETRNGGGEKKDNKNTEKKDDKKPKDNKKDDQHQVSPDIQSQNDTEIQIGDIQLRRAQQIIEVGKKRNADEMVIQAAISAAITESTLKNLASKAVPESLSYPNDGVAEGDADSVGLYQQRVSVWGEKAGGIKGLMDPEQQINWFYDTAETVPHDSVGQIGADVERPAEQYRGRYTEHAPQAKRIYDHLKDGVSGSLLCGSGSAETADELGGKILAAAREQFGMPYIWGGGDHKGPTGNPPGFDCSGLTMYAVAKATGGDVKLLHQTNLQMNDPNLEKITWENRRPGDLLYFGGPTDYHHVSIYSGEKDGKDMQYEAQMAGVPLGEYPVRKDGDVQVRRVKFKDKKLDNKNTEKKDDKKPKDNKKDDDDITTRD